MGHAFADQATLTELAKCDSLKQLEQVLARTASTAGFRHYALIEHDIDGTQHRGALRLHNYPAHWANFHDDQVAVSDPIWSISETRCSAFAWIDELKNGHVTRAGERVLQQAERSGVFGGITVPGNVARQRGASCSFATPFRTLELTETVYSAQILGTAFLDTARRIKSAQAAPLPPTRLTIRQKECVLWVARGKGDWEIAQILGLSPLTVTTHLRNAQEAFDVTRRTALLSEAIREGSIDVSEI